MTAYFRQFHGLFDTQFYRLGYWKVIKRERVPQHVVTHSRRLLYHFRTHFHPYVPHLLTELDEKDIDGLEALDTRVPELREDFFEDRYKPGKTVMPTVVEDFGSTPVGVVGELPAKDLDFSPSGGYSVYNWEVFYHVPFTIAVQLSKNQRYAEAQRWFQYIFDPTDNSSGPTPQRFWKVRPFQVDEVDQIEEILLNLSTGSDPELSDNTITAIGAWRDNPFRPHAVARTRPTAYMYKTVMAYLDNLIAWGDSLFRQDTRESINEAMQLYVLAANILGPRPQAVPRKGTIKRETYATLADDLDEFGNAARDLEAEIPFDLLPTPQPVKGHPEDELLRSLGRSLYFCVPRNDKLIGYWDTVGDRLFKIRNSLNLQGVFRQLPLFEPPIDPAMLARAVAAGVDVAAIIAGTDAPPAPVRFQVLLQKALEVCQEVKSLGAQILAALEKKDNEALGVLRAKHESNLLGLAEAVRYAQWQEAIRNKESIERSIDTASQRYAYYELLLGRATSAPQLPAFEALDPAGIANLKLQTTEVAVAPKPVPMAVVDAEGAKLSENEAAEFASLKDAQDAQGTATTMEVLASSMNVIPTFGGNIEPFGIGMTMSFGGSNIGAIFSAIAAGYRGSSGRSSYEANRISKISSYNRREQEWAHQSNLAAAEVTQLYKQLRAAEIREHLAKREYENHKKQIAQAKDIEDFLTNEKRKKTTEDFYLWMKREAQGLHSRCFQFAYDVAKKAERSFRHELGDETATFIQMGYLGGRDGLFAGEKLYLDLKRLDMAYAELNQREYELTKHISLREWYPLALESLRRTGSCSIELAEQIFDLDCPGHYYRRIKSVAVSIPSVTGPYTSVNCNLRLEESKIRKKPTSLGGKWYPDDPSADERFDSFGGSSDSIVTSSSQNDTGMFETNLRDERYLPFEGSGVISKWTLELLGKPRSFDYDTIADVVLTVRYTSRAGAPAATVSSEAEAWLKANAVRLISMRHEFPSEWARFQKTQLTAGQKAALSFELKEEHFPFRMREMFTNAKRMHLFGRTKTAQVEAELLHGNSFIPPAAPPPLQLVGKTTLISGEGVIPPPPPAPPAPQPEPISLDPRGRFELRFDSAAFDDLWLVIDWSDAPISGT
jgi:hypothetical protein